jgi:hypothetical protein
MSIHRHGGSRAIVCDCCRMCVRCGASGRVSQGGGYNMLCPSCREYVWAEERAGRKTPFTI